MTPSSTALKRSRTGRLLLEQHGAAALAAVIFLIYALLISFSRAVPALTDYSDWIYEGVLFKNHLLGVSDAAHVLKHYPVPNSAATVGIGLLTTFLSWHVAARLWLCFLILFAFAATCTLMAYRAANNTVWFIAPAGLFLGVNFWYGFVNFQLGLCFTILIASLLLRNTRRDYAVGVLLVCTFFTHMIPFLFASLCVVLYARQARRPRLLLQLLPGALLSLWYVLGRWALGHNGDGSAGMVGAVKNYSAAFWAYKVNSYMKSLGFVNPGTDVGSVSLRYLGPALFVLLFVLNLLLCVIIARALVRSGMLAFHARTRERFLWQAAILFFCLYLVAPATMLGISDPGSRLLQTALVVLVPLLTEPMFSSRPALRWAAGCAVSLQVIALFLFTKVALSPTDVAPATSHLPHRIAVFSHVPNHAEDYYSEALGRGDMTLRVFPTALFLNTPSAVPVPTSK